MNNQNTVIKTSRIKLLIALLFIFSTKIKPQTLSNFVIPTGFIKVLETKGDLDSDGIDEVIMVFNNGKNKTDVGFKRELYILKKINNTLKIWKTNSTVLWHSKDCGFCEDKGINLTIQIKNSAVVISQTFWHNTRHTSIYRNVFRFQNNDWFLIGSTYNDKYNCSFDYTYDINFSTKLVRVTYESEDCDDEHTPPSPSQKNFKYPFKEIPKMDGFYTGKGELKIPNSTKYFYY